MANTILNDRSFTGIPGDVIQQEVLIIPDETFGEFPVAYIYQRTILQENGPDLEVAPNRIRGYNGNHDPHGPPNSTPPNLTIDQVALEYFGSNPSDQGKDPNYSQRSSYFQPVWHFHESYEDGSEFDVLIQSLQPEFLPREIAPGNLPG